MRQDERSAIVAGYSCGVVTAAEARRQLGDISFGELLRLVADAGMTLPRAPVAGREETLRRAREWLFPKA